MNHHSWCHMLETKEEEAVLNWALKLNDIYIKQSFM